MVKLILVRHGQSSWNALNKFTGWVDIDLSDEGISEAKKSGMLIKKNSINIDISFTSYLKRAIRTLTIILEQNQKEKKFNASWEMNERHYGSLTGLNKKETLEKLGEKKFKMYRRSWETSPPPIPDNDENLKLFSPLNSGIPKNNIPKTESLKNTYDRVVPFYQKEIAKYLKSGKNVLISAHGNSLRALCKYLFKISDSKINELEIPTGNPLVVDFSEALEIVKYLYLDSKRKKKIFFNQ